MLANVCFSFFFVICGFGKVLREIRQMSVEMGTCAIYWNLYNNSFLANNHNFLGKLMKINAHKNK